MTQGFDVIVVGAGSAGCVVAARSSEDGSRSVLLVEAGPDRTGSISPALRDGWGLARGPDWTDDWGYASEARPGADPSPLRRGKLVGGTSWLTRFAVRGAPADYDAWAARGLEGWSFDDVLPFFRRVERDHEFGRAPWHGNAGPVPITRYPDRNRAPVHVAAIEAFVGSGFDAVEDVNAPGAFGIGPMPMSSVDGHRVSAADAYLADAASRPNLMLRPETEVVSIIVADGRARGVRLGDGSTIAGDQIVVCAGTYGSPTLLLRSGIGPGDELREIGIGVVAELPGVGRNLADHPAVEIDVGWTGTSTEQALHSIAPWRSATTGATESPDMLFWLVDPSGDPGAFSIECDLMRPRSRGQVRLRSSDPAEPPRISLPSLSEQADVTRLGEGALRLREIAMAPGLRKLCDAEPTGLPNRGAELDQWVRENAYSVPHVVGTCAMGVAAADGAVVDAGGRVHGVEGLRVVDASIIPEPPSGFPNLLTMMLAERIAAAI
jgi:choline dehydrogenase